MPTLYEILKAKAGTDFGNIAPPKGSPFLSSGQGNLSSLFNGTQNTLPNGGGTYSSMAPVNNLQPVNNSFSAPPAIPQVSNNITPARNVAPTGNFNQPTGAPQKPTQTQSSDAEWYKPDGSRYTAQEVANNRIAAISKGQSNGSVPNYVQNQMRNPDQTESQLTTTATDLNNTRNDIATGTTDPYGSKKSGLVYSPQERAAIEKAYAGIYDPALTDVFNKLKVKQDANKAEQESKTKLIEMAQQHQYDMELKKTPTAAQSTSVGGVYIPGENPAVDAWAQGIIDQTRKITDIPASYKGMRNLVQQAVVAQGNQLNGKPTTTEIGLQTLDAAKRLRTMLEQGKGTEAVGGSRLFTAGALRAMRPGSDAYDFTNLYNTVIANRSLEGVKFLKGQGQVSDAERLLLKQAMSELQLGQGEETFKNSLDMMINKLEGNAPRADTGSTGGVTVTDPNGGIHSFPNQASADAFKKAAGI